MGGETAAQELSQHSATNLLIKEIYLHAIHSSEKNFLRVGQDSDICKYEFCIK